MKRVAEPCTIHGCRNLSHTKKTRGMCSMHWARVFRTGDAGEPESRMHPKVQCPIGRCDGFTVLGRPYCSKHYRHYIKWGHAFRKPLCVVYNCERIVQWSRKDGRKEYCRKHQIKMGKWGLPYRPCSLSGCNNKHASKGLCNKHYKAKRRAENIQVRLASNLRSRIRTATKNGQKAGSAIKDLGCSIDDFKEHMENQFERGMSWDNWGLHGWHIDHIRPLMTFDLSNKVQFREANRYTNLRPLWAYDNLSRKKSQRK